MLGTASKRLIGRGGIFLASSVLNAAIPFLLLPVLTRVLSPEDYGTISMFAIFLSFTNTFVGLSVHGAINVQYFKLDSSRFAEYVTNCLILLLLSTAFTFIVVSLSGAYLQDFVGIPYKWMLIAVVTSFFQFFITIILSIWVVTGSPIKYGILQISQTLSNAGFSLFLIFIIGLFWEGRLWGQTLTAMLFGVVSFFLIYKSNLLAKPQNTKADIKNALMFGLPLIPHTIGGFLMTSTDRYMIKNLVSISAVGIYMVGLQLGQAMGLLSDSFNKVYSPWIMKNLSDKDLDKIKLVKSSYFSMAIFLLIGVLWGIGAKIALPILTGDKFAEAGSVIIYMSIGHSVTGLYYIVTNYIFYAEKTVLLAIITFTSAILNIPLTYLLTKFYSIEGAALAFLVLQAFFFLLTWFLSHKVFPMPWFYFLKGRKSVKSNRTF